MSLLIRQIFEKHEAELAIKKRQGTSILCEQVWLLEWYRGPVEDFVQMPCEKTRSYLYRPGHDDRKRS